MNITVYTKDHCPLCDQAKALLKLKALPFDEVQFGTDRCMQMLEHYPMVRQFPVVFIDNTRVGGFEGLKAALAQLEERGREL